MAKYVIVGGVAGGATASARLRRCDERAEIILLDRGEYVSYANCGLPYYAGGVIEERSKLFVMTPDRLRAALNIDVRVLTEATSIDRDAKSVSLTDLATGRTYQEAYDALILAPGAQAATLPVPGRDLEGIFTLRSIPDIDRIIEWMHARPREHAVIVGGGSVGLEMAENLNGLGMSVTLVETSDQVAPMLDFEMAALVHRELRENEVELRLGTGVSAFEERVGRLLVTLSNGDGILADIVILALGVRPDTMLAQNAGLATIGPDKPGAGAILVDEHFRTSDPSIRALGDAIAFVNPLTGEVGVSPLAGPASKQARLLADALVYGEDAARPWKGSIGSAVTKVFGRTAAVTGVNEKTLERLGRPHAGVIVHAPSHAGYYPEAVPLTLKLVYDPTNSAVLGAQAVGYGGVDKRIDVVSALIGMGADVTDLCEFEQAYAPPFSSARDPVNLAGFIAENALEGRSTPVSWRAFEAMREEGAFVLDVRTREEAADGTVPGAVVIPHTELRGRLAEVPKAQRILVYCSAGYRSYHAERILLQNGWTDVKNLTGGYTTWEAATERQDSPRAYPARSGLWP
jgi:NADPH-dependent 2,4-dienoyl-CoA reductase/sulfur reductase-like enzyme/rhodanese-related sulfurtransferase